MAGLPRVPLLLLAALVLALAVRAAAGPGKAPMPGGLAEANVDEEGVQQALNFAVREYNKASNDAFHSRAVRVLRARKQVVAGLNYYLDVEMGRTTCTKSQSNLASCPFHVEPSLRKKAVCSFQIYTVPWLGKTSMVKSSCQNA